MVEGSLVPISVNFGGVPVDGPETPEFPELR